MSKFWDKVEKCNHKNISPNYLDGGQCETSYCEWSEDHCLDCGVYITKCGCGYCNRMDGWPWKKRKKNLIDYIKIV